MSPIIALTVESRSIEVREQDAPTPTGDLTLLGMTRPVTLSVTPRKLDSYPFA